MAILDHPYVEKRNAGRRKEDWLIRDLNAHYRQIFNIGQSITSEIDMEILFEVIIEQTNEILNTERSTLFLHDEKGKSLWSLVATGLKKNEIRIPSDFGVAGWVFHSRIPLVINDCYRDPRFSPSIDRMTGFRTRKILCIPLTNRERHCIGTLEALNKRSGDFTEEDVDLLTSVSHYITIALENAKLYADLKTMDKAKERVINHLSHELTTPVAIVAGVLTQISKDLKKGETSRIERTIRRGFRNVDRLQDLKIKTDDIINMRSLPDRDRITGLIEDALSFVEEQRERDPGISQEDFLQKICDRLENLCKIEENRQERIFLPGFLKRLCEEVISNMGQRDVRIVGNFEMDLFLYMDKGVLGKVCAGLLKNAVENTPDEGKVEIATKSDDEMIEIDVRDYGVGISPENQKLIFGGFFHTQDTRTYSSKKPYEFNAGGAGADLLRTRIFSERFGFSVDFESTRCIAIPGDGDICPGKISSCGHVGSESECFSSGGSTFSVRFPRQRFGTG